MKKAVFLIPLLSLVSACQPPLTREQELAIYRSRCMDYGYQWGTKEFADCMMQQELKEQEFNLQARKVQALESQNYIEQQKVRAKEQEVELKRKELKKKYW